MMKKIFITFSVIVLFSGGIVGYIMMNNSKEKVEVKEVQSVNANGKTTTTIKTTKADPSKNKSKQHFPMDMSENDVQEAIHGMSHQKVKANEKWHFELLTNKRVKRLIKVVKHNEYKHQSLYINILKRWKRGDFSKVVKDHNEIWDLEGGTVGIATRKLSPEEEKHFIDEHYDVVD